MSKPKHTTTASIVCHLGLLTRLKLLFGWKLEVLVETSFKTYDPGVLRSQCMTRTISPLCRWFGHKAKNPELSNGLLVTNCRRCGAEILAR